MAPAPEQVQRPSPSHHVAQASIGHAAPGGHGSHASWHAFPAHGSQHIQGVSPLQRPNRSHAEGMSVGQGVASPHGLHASPHRFPAQGSGEGGGGEVQDGSAATQRPAASQWPRRAGIMQGGVAERHAGSIAQGSPHDLPAHGSSGGAQVNVPAATHAPAGSQAFTNCASTQSGSPGSQSVHAAPHALPAQGWYEPRPQPPRAEAATASTARQATTSRTGSSWTTVTPPHTDRQGMAGRPGRLRRGGAVPLRPVAAV